MSAKTYLFAGSDGEIKNNPATDISTGTANAGDIAALDDSGKLDISLIPEIPLSFITGDARFVGTAGEDLSAGDFVGVVEIGGNAVIRKASSQIDIGLNKYIIAVGFVKESYLNNDVNVAVYDNGTNLDLVNLMSGITYYLSTAGTVTTTINNTAAEVLQKVGQAISTSELLVTIDNPIIRS